MHPLDTILELKEMISIQYDAPSRQQIIFSKDVGSLEDNCTVASYGIKQGDVLWVSMAFQADGMDDGKNTVGIE